MWVDDCAHFCEANESSVICCIFLCVGVWWVVVICCYSLALFALYCIVVARVPYAHDAGVFILCCLPTACPSLTSVFMCVHANQWRFTRRFQQRCGYGIAAFGLGTFR